MLIETSIGDIIDKYSILQLKYKKIKCEKKLFEIKNEITNLKVCEDIIFKYEHYYALLLYINDEIWKKTDIIKNLDYKNNIFSEISNDIFKLNQKRFRLKNLFNIICYSNIKEQKSYEENSCEIIIDNIDTLIKKIPEINYLSFEYDVVSIKTNTECVLLCKKIFNPLINYNNIKTTFSFELKNFIISDELKDVYDFKPHVYISSGTLGDFIHQLSIINEKFYETGKKGILYITDKYNLFRTGVNNTYNDTYEIVSKQIYIKDYKIYNNENYDINLSEWRKYPSIFNNNEYFKQFKNTYLTWINSKYENLNSINGTWYNIFNTVYNIDWAKHKWLDIPTDKKWENIILINSVSYRDISNLDFTELKNYKYEKIIFITNNENDYNHFKNKHKLNIDCYYPKNFYETCVVINSCKLFIGSLSAFLTIAHACNIKHIIGLELIGNPELNKDDCIIDALRISNINKIIYSSSFTL